MKKCLSLILLLCCLSSCGIAREDASNAKDDKMTIALLDTGVSTAAINSGQLLQGWNYVLDNEDTEDRINHGTAVASVILGCESADVEGMAPEAFLVPLVVTDRHEKTESVTPDVLARAIRDG